MFGPERKYWIVVASREHVQTGVSEGVCQACHGKEEPLGRMKKGDWVVFYSSKEIFGRPEKCQRFTAIGRIRDNLVYQFQMSESFSPFRRAVEFFPCEEVAIDPLISMLSFIRNKQSWGYILRFGLIQIPREDFMTIAAHMLPVHPQVI